MMKNQLTIALAGNPNSGKTSLFNFLTGANQKVANYPGVTVEKKEGKFKYREWEIRVVDLPGIYSLTAQSLDEKVARQFLLEEKPDVVVDVLDLTNLERNLYLATQLMEMKVPLVLAMNMSDVAKRKGVYYDFKQLERLFNVTIVPTVGSKGQGMDALKAAIISRLECTEACDTPVVRYSHDIEKAVEKIQTILEKEKAVPEDMDPRWIAVKLLETDTEIQDKINAKSVLQTADLAIRHLQKLTHDPAYVLIAEARYGFISGACQEAIMTSAEIRHDFSDKVDAVVANRVLGFPIFLLIMYLIFQLTFSLGEAPMGWIEGFFGWLGSVVSSWWPTGSDGLLKSLLIDGIIGGVGGVLVFLPNIVLLFLGISLLEDSGYMSRAAFIVDKLMHKIGLHGKSCIPMIIGFGCTVPAIMATRTMENRRDRLITMMILPLMSCGARLPIYALIAPVFFPGLWTARVVMMLYLIGIIIALAGAKLLSITVFKGESAPFVMELPPYRLPTMRSIFLHMWEKSWLYLKKAGTVILAVSVILWALAVFPKSQETPVEVVQSSVVATDVTGPDKALATGVAEADALKRSYIGRIGGVIAPIFKPLGFDWRISTAMLGSFAAKEVFVAQMGIVFSLGEVDEESTTLRQKLKKNYSPLVAFCMMLFMLIATPCIATVIITRKESGSWKWALAQFGGLTAVAYVLTLLVYQTGSWLGLGF
ncbi:ferrous iron transport protein B [bacterium]|nr:ferrous iron transport protein B [bacterium]